MSLRRSRSGGITIRTTFRRYQRSWRNLPSSIICWRLRLVAAITRTSTSLGREEPTGRISRSCRKRSSFTWKSGSISPISSRKTVPRLADSKMPTRSRSAPVNAPRMAPNSSLSSSAGGDGRAIHRHERLRGALAEAVDHARHQLLAGAGLALDEHGGGRWAPRARPSYRSRSWRGPCRSSRLSGSSSSAASSPELSREASARSTVSIITSRSNGLAM